MKINKDIVLSSKLINVLIFVLILFIIYQMKQLFGELFIKIYNVVLPIFISFTVAYIIYPLYRNLNKYLPKFISILLIYISIILIVISIIYSLVPNSKLINEFLKLSNYIMKFITNISNKYNLDIKNMLTNEINNIANNILYFITNIINFLFNTIMVLILSIYFLINIDNIKKYLKKNLKVKYKLLKNINTNINNYFHAVIKIILIQTIEYTVIYYLIGHPNFLLLGILNALTSFIPVFGNLITNAVALVISSVISKKLFLLTAITILILPNIDSYLITPKIYKSSNKISPIISILSVFIFGALFGITGVLLSIPLTIIIITIIEYYKEKDLLKNTK